RDVVAGGDGGRGGEGEDESQRDRAHASTLGGARGPVNVDDAIQGGNRRTADGERRGGASPSAGPPGLILGMRGRRQRRSIGFGGRGVESVVHANPKAQLERGTDDLGSRSSAQARDLLGQHGQFLGRLVQLLPNTVELALQLLQQRQRAP